jgi:hypothetical protein
MKMAKYILILVICLLTASCATYTPTKAALDETQSVLLVPKQQTIRGVPELLATIAEIRGLDFSKGEYEKEEEFLARMASYYQKYDGRRFLVPVSCDIAIDDKKKLVSYDVESETATLKFPDMDIEGVVLKQGEKITFPDYRYSFIPASEPEIHTSTYTASNAFGREVGVTKLERNRIGLAVLTAGTKLFKGSTEFWSTDAWIRSLPKPLEITFPIPREIARTSLEGCVVNLDVQAQYDGIWHFHKQQFIFHREHARRMLFVSSMAFDPTISRPVELKTKDEGLPVDLLGLSVISPSGQQLLQKKFY